MTTAQLTKSNFTYSEKSLPVSVLAEANYAKEVVVKKYISLKSDLEEARQGILDGKFVNFSVDRIIEKLKSKMGQKV